MSGSRRMPGRAVVVSLLALAHPGAGTAQTPTLEAVAFMAGTWCSSGGPDATVIEEHYTSPSANLVLGTTRYLRGGTTVGYEVTRIEMDSTGVVLTPAPSGQAPVPFPLVEASPGSAVFENPDHDFPVRIEYRRRWDTLVARATGGDGEGPEWRMTPCPPAQSGEGWSGSGGAATADGIDPVFEILAGAWEGSGTLFGTPARFSMEWDIADGMARLRYTNALVDARGETTPVLTAFATYRTAGPADGTWFDTRGQVLRLTSDQVDGALVVSWRAPDESGRTTYRPLEDGTVDVVDEVFGPDGWRAFGHAVYTRGSPAP